MVTEFTDLEKLVFNTLVDHCMDDVEADIDDLSLKTRLTVSTVKGVIGSLVKKGVVHVDSEKRDFKTFKTINPIIDGKTLSFGGDQYDQEEIDAYKL
ncbi:helix-turn-helix domain-containing protein [Pseudoalteromonas sp. OFAV1]|uniref:helix-turn-helix domain-containing protein n=1 Tax=Pseudoalteromonas sp. OFAV1 TaxID=2908892 RepID=UPI001F3CFF5D|nr:helix-turn-helix domain-containing protein [Pseudoalteromonas sp. OFAV1]MCF2901151.1 helix-turn-helix domain-containing protein [Pseudoalteromonas sp. OFAV1]